MNGHTPAGQSAGRRVLVPEKVSQEGLALLTDICQVDVKPGLNADELLACIGQYQGLIIRSETQVNAKVLQAARQLKVVARAGVGVDNIDVNAATANGVIVVNSPSGNIAAAAEHTIALLLATARNVGRADASVKNGKWERSKLVGAEVGGKTLGIVGLGKVGFKVARMAIGLGMKVSAMDPYANADMANRAGVTLVSTLQDLLPISDFFTIHTPLLASTLDLLGEEELKKMKKTARVLNVARGGVYNEAALLKALDEGWITGAGIDVFTSEPPEKDSTAAKLAAHPKVVATPHLGASTVEAQENVSLDVCAQVAEIMKGGVPTSAVNAPLILPEEYRKLQPFVKLIEKMGSLYTQTQALFSNRGKRRRSGSSAGSGVMAGRRFELIYQGELASIKNTRPLLAALVKGLVSSISDSGGREVNIVNASLIAKEKGLVISETHSPVQEDLAYASLVTLRASYRNATGHIETRVIEGYAAANQIYVSRLDRFTANFHPEGTLIVLHNYDEPGKIGGVGGVLGGHRINILFMQVASLDLEAKLESGSVTSDSGPTSKDASGNEHTDSNGGDNEALMILGVAGQITKEVLEDLDKSEGILGVSLVRL